MQQYNTATVYFGTHKFIIVSSPAGTGSLKMLNVSVPSHLLYGHSASLHCNFDLEGSTLYSVKWYKNGEEFYRYLPSMERPYGVFGVPGVNMDVSTSNYASVHLLNIFA